MTKFQDLGLKEEILKGIREMGFEEAFPIQEAVIPVLLSGRDVVGQAHTGSGKTAAFALAMLNEIQPKKGIQGLIMAPTRELAIQTHRVITDLSKYIDGVKCMLCIGKTNIQDSIREAKTNQIVIGNGSTGHGDNIMVLGNNTTTSIEPGSNNQIDLGASQYQFNNLYFSI